METPIEKIALSIRAYNCAKRFGINTVEELEEHIDEFCNHAPNFGKQAREVLRMRKINLRTIGVKQEETKTMIEPQMKTPPADTKQAVTDKYTEAYNLNVRICVNAQMAQQNLYEVCKGLKEMRDGKLYKELGYNSFEAYTENEVGLKRRQAYNFISVAEAYGENVQSIAHFGTTKLALLAKLDEPQREEIQQTVNVEEVSVRELKKQIAQLEKDLKDQQGNYAMHTKRREDEIAGYKERQDKLLTRNKELVKELEQTEKRLDQTENDLDEANETVQSLSRQLEELESRPRDSYEDTTKIEELKKQLAEAEQRAKEVNKSAYSDNAVFNAYASAATDAMRRLTQFCEQNRNSSEKTVFVAKLKMIVTLTEQTIEKIGG